MDTRQIELIQRTFALIAPQADKAANLFYARLFQLDPALRGMFNGDMREQKRKLMQMLTMVVQGLNRLDTVLEAARQLGLRHRTYGVTERHYILVGEALLWTLQHALGSDYTPKVNRAWLAVYTVLANTMQAAARPEEPQSSSPEIPAHHEITTIPRTEAA